MFLKVREISEHLRISERTVWTLIKDGRLSATRINRNNVRIHEDELLRFINECTDRTGELSWRDHYSQAESSTPAECVAVTAA